MMVFARETNRRPSLLRSGDGRPPSGHAHAFEPIQEGRIYTEKLDGPFLFADRGTPAEYAASLDRAIVLGWLEPHESGTFVKLTPNGADLFAQSQGESFHE